jgi:hypothetical protein
MLSLFPQILFLAPFSALLIRLTIAVILVLCAWAHISRPQTSARIIGVLEIAAAGALFVGAWTQAVALVVAISIVIGFFFPQIRVFPRSTMYLVIVLCISVLVTGAGAFALDLPL